MKLKHFNTGSCVIHILASDASAVLSGDFASLELQTEYARATVNIAGNIS